MLLNNIPVFYFPSHFRADCEYIKKVVKPFDWTFTTNYKGTLLDKGIHHMEVITFKYIYVASYVRSMCPVSLYFLCLGTRAINMW